MSDLVEFLRARLDEDGAAVRKHSCALDCMGRIHQDWHRVQLARERGDTVERLAAMGLGLENVGAWNPDGEHTIHPDSMHGTALDPARVLREVEAKRRIVEQWATHEALDRETFDAEGEHARSLVSLRAAYWDACRELAAVYADHPDYRPEWAQAA